jgi:hypothetical protein
MPYYIVLYTELITCPRSDPQAVLEDRCGGDRGRPRCVRAFNVPVGGAGTALRVESGLERGGASREGLGPSSEAGTRPRGRQALERGGGFRGAVPAPRARRRFARGALGAAVCWAPEAFWAMGLSLPRAAAMWGVVCSCGFDCLLLLLLLLLLFKVG